MLEWSQSESDRFGLRTFRLRTAQVDAGALWDALAAERCDLLVLRFPIERRQDMVDLTTLGFPVVTADALVYYTVDLQRHEPRPLRNPDLSFTPVGASDLPTLRGLVDEIFADYHNHYAANRFLRRADYLEGYKEWAAGFASAADKQVWLVRRGEDLLGFCTCSWSTARSEAEGVLFGVRPQAAGGGVYGDMIRFTQAHFLGQGCRRMRVSTQVENFAVQKVWAREGFVLDEALVTVHVLSFLDHSLRPALEQDWSPAQADALAAWATDQAQAAFPELRLRPRSSSSHVHGEPPSAGRVRLSYPALQDGRLLVLARVTDAERRLRAVSYFELDALEP